jgi:hypothetical protein
MAYKVIILYRLYMPSYFLGTFTEYPETNTLTPCTVLSFLMLSMLISFRYAANKATCYLPTHRLPE